MGFRGFRGFFLRVELRVEEPLIGTADRDFPDDEPIDGRVFVSCEYALTELREGSDFGRADEIVEEGVGGADGPEVTGFLGS